MCIKYIPRTELMLAIVNTIKLSTNYPIKVLTFFAYSSLVIMRLSLVTLSTIIILKRLQVRGNGGHVSLKQVISSLKRFRIFSSYE